MMETCKIKTDYYENGNIHYKKYYNINKQLHNENGPAEIHYYENGNMRYEEYYINGELHRKDGPAIINYYENGNILCKIYYSNNELHNENGPAVIGYSKDGLIECKEYYINGKFIMTNEEVEKYINSTKPIRIKDINKLKILYNICKARNLEDKAEEIIDILLLETLQK